MLQKELHLNQLQQKNFNLTFLKELALSSPRVEVSFIPHTATLFGILSGDML